MRIFLILSILTFFTFPNVVFAADLDANGKAVAIITLNNPPTDSAVGKALPRTEVVRLSGPVKIQTSEIGDVDDDGKADVQTEIVDMNLTGKTPFGLAINLNSSKSNRSMGMAEELRSNPFPFIKNRVANSFFDVFLELRHTPFHNSVTAAVIPDEVLTSCESVRFQGISKSLADLSGVYTQRMSGKITLCGIDGNPAGSLSLFAINLNSSKSN